MPEHWLQNDMPTILLLLFRLRGRSLQFRTGYPKYLCLLIMINFSFLFFNLPLRCQSIFFQKISKLLKWKSLPCWYYRLLWCVLNLIIVFLSCLSSSEKGMKNSRLNGDSNAHLKYKFLYYHYFIPWCLAWNALVTNVKAVFPASPLAYLWLDWFYRI